MSKIVKFEEFINPHSESDYFKNKAIDFNDLSHCSYVFYFIIEHINGEIVGNYFILDFDSYDELLKYYYSSYLIYAINVLDKIVCEVV